MSTRHLVDPQIAPMLDMPSLDLTAETLSEIRSNPMFTGAEVPPPPFPVNEAWAPVPDGPDVRLVVMNPPSSAQGRGAVLHLHGGGMVVGSADRAVAERAAALLQQFHLAEVADQKTEHLAYGKRRLLEIAIALACEPRVLLLDEPVAGVPAGEREELLQTVAALPADVSVLLIEHDMDLVFSFADRMTVLVDGAVLTGPLDGPPVEGTVADQVDERLEHADGEDHDGTEPERPELTQAVDHFGRDLAGPVDLVRIDVLLDEFREAGDVVVRALPVFGGLLRVRMNQVQAEPAESRCHGRAASAAGRTGTAGAGRRGRSRSLDGGHQASTFMRSAARARRSPAA